MPAVKPRTPTSAQWSATNTVTINKPTGSVTNDCMLAFIAINTAGSTITITPPSGWVLSEDPQITGSGSTEMTLYGYTKPGNSADGTTYTWGFSANCTGIIVNETFFGTRPASQISAHNKGVSASGTVTPSFSAVTTDTNGCQIISFSTVKLASVFPASPDSRALELGEFTHSGTPSIAGYLQHLPASNAGTSWTPSATFSTSGADGWASITIAVRPSIFYQSGANNLSGAGTTVGPLAWPDVNVKGSTMVAMVYWAGGGTCSVSDGFNGAWTAIGTPQVGTGGLSAYRIQAFVLFNNGAYSPDGIQGVTATLSIGGASRGMAIHEYTPTYSVVEGSSYSSDSASSGATGALTPTLADSVLVAADIASTSAVTCNSPFTQRETTNFASNGSADDVTPVPGTSTSCTFTGVGTDNLKWIGLFSNANAYTDLGYNVAGPSTHIDNNLPDRILATGYFTTDANGGPAQDAWVYFDQLASGTTVATRGQACRVVLFNDVGNVPGTTVIGVTDEVVVKDTTIAGTWIKFPTWTGGAPTLAPSTKYWVGFWWGTQVGGDNRFQVTWDFSILPTNSRVTSTATYSSTAAPTVTSWSDTGTAAGDSWFVEYLSTPSAGPVIVIPFVPHRMPLGV